MIRPRRAILRWACALACAIVGPSAVAAPASGTRPAAAGRIVRVFDFEESAFNADPVPRYWFRAQDNPPERQRAGFPPFNRAAFDRSIAVSGTTSVKLPVSGGSTSLRLSATVLPIFADADYRVTAMVRTQGLRHARALISARLLTQAGESIPGSEWRSEPTLSPDAFRPVGVTIPSLYPNAAFIQIELLVLQPDQWQGPTPPLGVPSQDLSGAAWFDDVAVFQLPRVVLSPASGLPIVYAPTVPKFVGEVRDLTGDALDIRLRLTDVDGATIASESRRLNAGGGAFEWEPAVPRLGWYEATMDVIANGIVVSRSRTAIVYASAPGLVPPPRPTAPATFPAHAHALAVLADDLESRDADEVAGLITCAGAASVTIPVDSALIPGDDTAIRLDRLRQLVDRLLAMDATVTLSLPRIPLAASPDLSDPLTQLGADPQTDAKTGTTPITASPALQDLMDLYGQRINRWQVSAAHPPEDEPPDAAERAQRLARARAFLARMIPGPHLSIGWRADWPQPPEGDVWSGASRPDGVIWFAPSSFSPETLESLAKQIAAKRAAASNDPADFTIVLDLPPEAAFGPRAAVTELSRRAILLWAALSLGDQRSGAGGSPPPVRLGVLAPWTRDDQARPPLTPTAVLATLKTLSELLAPSRAVGRLTTESDIHAVILARTVHQPDGSSHRTGTLAVWSDRPAHQGEHATLRTYLGSGPLTLIDMFGNRRPLEPADASGLFEVPLDETPTFVDGIDPELCLFVTGVSVTPNFVPAVASLHEHELVLTNPWPVRASGTVQLVPDTSVSSRAWGFSPTTPIAFSIGPGGTQRAPFSFTFPASEEAGPRTLTAVVRLSASQTYPALKLKLPITIGSRDLDFNVAASVTGKSASPDAVLTATVTNTGRGARTLQVEVQAPGQPQQRQPVSNLQPGETAVRRFVFPGAGNALTGRRLRVTLSDVDGAERLNRSALVP